MTLKTAVERCVLSPIGRCFVVGQGGQKLAKRPAFDDRKRIKFYVTGDEFIDQPGRCDVGLYMIFTGVNARRVAAQACIKSKPRWMRNDSQFSQFVADLTKWHSCRNNKLGAVGRRRYRRGNKMVKPDGQHRCGHNDGCGQCEQTLYDA